MSVDSIIEGVVARESDAYTNRLADAGGPTKYGITLRTLSRWRKFPMTAADVQALTRSEAVTIYRWMYVEDPGFDALLSCHPLAKPIAEKVIDAGVLSGPGRSSEWLQRALNAFNRRGTDYLDLKVDGDCGPVTVSALRAYLTKRGRHGAEVFVEALQALQGEFLIGLAERRPPDEENIYGWFAHRVSLNSGAHP
jgi:lysozyme family protein